MIVEVESYKCMDIVHDFVNNTYTAMRNFSEVKSNCVTGVFFLFFTLPKNENAISKLSLNLKVINIYR